MNTSQKRIATNANAIANTGSNSSNIVLKEAQFQWILVAAQGIAPGSSNNQDFEFALSPALINLNKPIDFLTSEGTKLNKDTIKALPLQFEIE